MHLHQGTLLQGGKYRIEKVLGQGGFGITYLAEQTMLGQKVCVKEFFMKDLCQRDKGGNSVSIGTDGGAEMVNKFREKFIKEARNIAHLRHPNIVRVTDVFEENGTAYYIMDYANGGSLSQKVRDSGSLSETEATKYILQIANALDYIHGQRMNHLDVKPANIILDEGKNAVLIDFGLSKQYDASSGNQTSSTPVGISEGYAPLEQYKQGGVSSFSPESDIYALGATFYYLLTEQRPPSASDVNEDGLPLAPLKERGISASVINLITSAMEPKKRLRLNNAKEFIRKLQEADSDRHGEDDVETLAPVDVEDDTQFEVEEGEVGKPQPEPVTDGQDDQPADIGNSNSKKGIAKWIIAEFAVAAVIIIGVVIGLNRSNESQELTPPTGVLNNHEAVDLGLSVKWATCNVGAENPEDYGDYFAWGETKPKSNYDCSTYFDTKDGGSTFTKYNNKGGKTQLDPEDDAATANWGSGWRMPTKDELDELKTKCTWTWTTRNGVNGYKVTGTNGNSIFLPAAGNRSHTDLYNAGSWGYYWSSSLCTGYSYSAYRMLFCSGYYGWYNSSRCSGFSVRAVSQN